ncbi:hypothetical protein [Serratia marcescens]|uniref:hypothetical protein n=1 Tax=Serratia marcescens TaxID=615 RepID=UPI000745577B|nr:hypothetical protein [Serratia marcescens]CVB30525.1 Uncharacterised protein [Serratia marcescens]CVB83702.1 Uncharacterised protein [Serratia marcescens]CVF87847.1 Uncharacterised protein [Serratia marcescens]CVG57739.1 Uncharacterised protein [Serratia marcescens]
MTRTLTTERQQFAEQNEMSMDFVNWFFDEKKDGCGNAWFIMAAAMWEGWKGRANREAQPFGYVYTSKDGVAVNFGYELPFMPEKWNVTPVYIAPPAPAVPDALVNDIDSDDHPLLWSYNNGWNACRAAMLAGTPNGGN